jgi:CRP-like cAMP-binding protein
MLPIISDGHGESSSSTISSAALAEHKLLRSLPKAEQQRIVSYFQKVPLPPRTILFTLEDNIEHCYFPLHGVISLTVGMNDGRTAEAGVVGCEGFIGAPVILGEERAGHEAIVQAAPCDALKIKSADLRRLCKENPDLNALLLRSINAQLVMTAQACACNALHTLEERLARWLLMVQDRVESDQILLTHEFLSVMLGTRRATVTLIAGTFERAGIIELRRGGLRVISRPKLENASCECYHMMQKALARVVSSPLAHESR